MKEIRILGAGGGKVTGAAFELTSNKGTTILVDCGMPQGQENDKHNNNIESAAKIVAVTHSHIDHIGKVPLSKRQVFMTSPSRAIADISLRNAKQIQNATTPNFYPEGCIEDMLSNTVSVPYDSPVEVDGLSLTFRNAGHILGASSIEIKEREGGDTVVFSGDLGNVNSRTVQKPTPIKGADVVVMETTYGGRNRPEESPVEVIEDAIKRIRKSKGTLLIPAFAIDRTQAVLNIFKELSEQKKLKEIPVFLDFPMAIEITAVYNNYTQMLNSKLEAEKRDPFSFSELIKTYNKRAGDKIYRCRGPKVIISGSGMMEGGRIMRHAAYCLPQRSSVILFVGYCAQNTLSREITDGEKKVFINEEYGSASVEATILKTESMSSHADQKQLLEWLGNISRGDRRLRASFLVHGEDPSRKEFAHKAKEQLGIDNIFLPGENDTTSLQ